MLFIVIGTSFYESFMNHDDFYSLFQPSGLGVEMEVEEEGDLVSL